MKVLQVKRNRVPVEIHEISVSAYPINRIWPGYQRNPDQTEPAWFVAFDMEQPVVLEVEYDSPVPDDLEIRPLEYKMRPEKISPAKSGSFWKARGTSRSGNRTAMMYCMYLRMKHSIIALRPMTFISDRGFTMRESSCPVPDRRSASTPARSFTA